MTTRRWTVVLTMLDSICVMDVATVSRTDGSGVEGVEAMGRRSKGR